MHVGGAGGVEQTDARPRTGGSRSRAAQTHRPPLARRTSRQKKGLREQDIQAGFGTTSEYGRYVDSLGGPRDGPADASAAERAAIPLSTRLLAAAPVAAAGTRSVVHFGRSGRALVVRWGHVPVASYGGNNTKGSDGIPYGMCSDSLEQFTLEHNVQCDRTVYHDSNNCFHLL